MVASLIRSVVADLARSVPPDECGVVSITEVIVSSELSSAKVYLTALSNPKQAVKFLEERSGQIRSTLAGKLSAHRIPELRFVIDNRPDDFSRMDRLLSGQS